MKTIFKPGLSSKAGLLFVLLISSPVYGQSQKGKVLSGETNSGIGFVNVGIIGRNTGTVTDESGNFTITLDKAYEKDSLRFSMIGYESKSFLIRNFKEDTISKVYLTPKSYDLPEIKVSSRKYKEIKIGTEVLTNTLRSGFAANDLGSELGIQIKVRGLVKLKNINFNVAVCTFDSVTYRLNVYKAVNKTDYRNILTQPIYITFSKDKINEVITYDLSKYSILVDGDVLIALELYRDLGEGRLLFHTEFFTGYTYHRKTSEGKWTKAPGVVGMYSYGQLIR